MPLFIRLYLRQQNVRSLSSLIHKEYFSVTQHVPHHRCVLNIYRMLMMDQVLNCFSNTFFFPFNHFHNFVKHCHPYITDKETGEEKILRNRLKYLQLVISVYYSQHSLKKPGQYGLSDICSSKKKRNVWSYLNYKPCT